MSETTSKIKFALDKTYRIDYNIQSTKVRFALNQVGPFGYVTIPAKDAAGIVDTECIFFDPINGNDSAPGDGTRSHPYLTPLKSANMTTLTVPYVVILNSVSHQLDLSGLSAGITSNYFLGIFSDDDKHTVTAIYYSLGYTPTDLNTVYVDSDNGNDGNPGTNAEPLATYTAAIAALAGAKNKILFKNSGTYSEGGFTIGASCAGIYALPGETPIIKPSRVAANTTATLGLSATAITAADAVSSSVCVLGNGHVVHVYMLAGEVKLQITSMDGTEVFTAEETISSETGVESPCVCRVGVNKFCVTWIAGDGTLGHPYRGKYQIYTELEDDPWTITPTFKNILNVSTPKSYFSAQLSATACYANSFGNIMLISIKSSDSSVHYMVVDNTGTLIRNNVNSGLLGMARMGVLSDDTFVLAGYTALSPNYPIGFIMIDYLGFITRNVVTVTSVSTYPNACTIPIFTDDYFSVIYEGSVFLEWCVFNFAGEFQSKTVSSAGSSWFGHVGNVVINGDMALVVYIANGSPPTIKAACLGVDGVEYSVNIAVADSKSGSVYYPSIAKSDSGTIFITYSDTSGYLNTTEAILSIYWDAIKVTSAAEMRGITIDLDNQKYLYRSIHATANFTALWCRIKNADYQHSLAGIFGLAVYGTANVIVKNSIIHANGGGVYAENNTVELRNNAMYGQKYGWSACITGAGTGVIVDHNTMISSPGALRLIGNNGSEVVTHNIMHDNDVNDIVADVAVTPEYSCHTGVSVGVLETTVVILGSINVDMVIHDLPLFLNMGIDDPDSIDFRLQDTDVLDYKDSPCSIWGYMNTNGYYPDDYKDLGCHDIRITQTEDSYSTYTFTKPRRIKPSYPFAGKSSVQLMSGAYESNYEGTGEILDVEYDGIENIEFDVLLKAMTYGGSYGNKIRWYGEPTSNPTVYGFFTILHETVSAASEAYRLTGTGRGKFAYKIGRGMSDIGT